MKAAPPVERTQHLDAPEGSHLFSVVIAYDNLTAGQRAMHTLMTLVEQFRGEGVEMRPQLWRFDLLEDPQWFAVALSDAIRADMLIISTSSTENLPGSMNRWLSQCLACKESGGGAIVALPAAGGEADTLQFHFVRNATTEAGLDFFMPQASPKSGAALPSAMLHQPSSGGLKSVQPYQHWGLNE